MNLSKSINVALAIVGKNRTWLARQLDCNKAVITNMGTGRRRVRDRDIAKLAGIFEMTVEQFEGLGEQADQHVSKLKGARWDE